jgi:hypothetical protein
MTTQPVNSNDESDKQKLSEYYLLLFQSEFSNLTSTKETSNDILYQVIEGMGKEKLRNGEYMDLYLCENLFSTLLPGLESLSKTIEKMIYHSTREDEREILRFNPCNYLGEFLMRNNPKYGKNQETHDRFLKFTRRERKIRMCENNLDILRKKIQKIYDQLNMTITKLTINNFVQRLDAKLGLKNSLLEYDWVEYFRVNKDDQKISVDKFFEAFRDSLLSLHSIDEEMLKVLLK